MRTLKDILISLDQISSYYGDKVPVDLWRAQKQQEAGQPVLRPILESKVLSNGATRGADIATEVRGGTTYVLCATRPRGVSTFDKPDVFQKGNWNYFRIPKGTELPEGLAIVEDKYNAQLDAVHYTVAPARDMPQEHFLFLLDMLATSVVLEEKKATHGRTK